MADDFPPDQAFAFGETGVPTASPESVDLAGGEGGQGSALDRIEGYVVIRALASGGMGTVYKAEQLNPRRVVALKVIKPGMATPSLLRRFEFEAQVLGHLHHPGIAQIYEAGTFDEPDGQTLIAGGMKALEQNMGGDLAFWDVPTRRLKADFDLRDAGVQDLVYSQTRGFVAANLVNGRIETWTGPRSDDAAPADLALAKAE